MEKYFFSDYNINNYFVPGGRFFSDNLVMGNCTDEIFYIYNQVHSAYPTPSCTITIDSALENLYEETAERIAFDEISKMAIARFIIDGLVAQDVLSKVPEEELQRLNKLGIDSSIVDIDIRDFLRTATMDEFAKVYPKVAVSFQFFEIFRSAKVEELSFLCPEGVKNKDLQMAINSYLAQRAPFNVKQFTVDSHLATIFTQNGTLIQSVHDYDFVDSNEFIKIDETIGKPPEEYTF